jgi:hypothetical protein
VKNPLCWKCGAAVLWRSIAGVPIAVEQCAPGTGDIALQLQLNGTEIAIPGVRTRFRRHSASCSSGSFVGAALERKVRL